MTSYNITNLPYPRFIGTKHCIDFKLDKDCILEQWHIPKETIIKLYQSQNFGVVIIPFGTQDTGGFIIPRTIFRW